jgi:hypothetical protein
MDVNENFMIMVNMGIVFSFFTFLVKTFVEWKKVRYKSHLHHKLVDRFGNVGELSDFLQTDAGDKFLNSLTIDGLAPKEKLLASMTKGIVLIFLGGALTILANVFIKETQFFYFFGLIAIALGVGFLVSMMISFHLSKKWGIIEKD